MAWFDGTLDYGDGKIKSEFPVRIADGLRMSKDGKKLAVLNRFDEGTELYALADPKIGQADNDYVFYHVFTGKDAAAARRAIGDFALTVAAEGEEKRIVLIRIDPDRSYMYSFGHISLKILRDQEILRALISGVSAEEDVFILPLKRYMYRCPVCGYRTLPYRAAFMICDECGWEDEGINGDEEERGFGPNGGDTIREYREEYLKRKAENPNYMWYGQFQDGESEDEGNE